MTCQKVQATISRHGTVILQYKSARSGVVLYDRYASDGRFCGGGREATVYASVQTHHQAAKGTFRWVSGDSRSTAYSIKTPAGTIGVRGTRFDFYVAPDGTTAVVLLSGAAQFCGAGGCVQLRNRCDCVIARPGARPDARRADSTVLTALGNEGAFPFLSGRQRLSGGFGASSGCGMSARVQGVPGQGKRNAASATRRASEPTPEPAARSRAAEARPAVRSRATEARPAVRS